MKVFVFIAVLFITATIQSQPLPRNMIFGKKPSTKGLIMATKLEAFMGKRARINVSISGLVTLVTKSKGGWFDIDAGNGKVITAHFKNYNINIPTSLKNHYIVAEGVAAKQFIAADSQHFAGDKDSHKRQKPAKKQVITFEVKGLRVDK
jgi:hypothetical protein